MKRCLSLVLAVLLLACVNSFAYAESVSVRVLAGSNHIAEVYQKTYPNRAVQIIHVDHSQGYRGNLAELLKDGDWDVAFLGTQECSLATLVKEGLATDLSVFPAITSLADNLYPSIRAAVTVDGKLGAFPVNSASSLVMGLWLMGSTSFSGTYQQRAAAHLQALGFTQNDQPKTFAQLCKLGERYMQQSQDVRKGTTFMILEGNTTQYVLNFLIDLYTSQYLATGVYSNFDTEVFRTALSQLAALSTALATDPKNTYDEDGYCYPLILDSSRMFINDATFLQLGDNQSISAQMGMAIINPKSQHIQEAVDYILLMNDQTASHIAPVFYQVIDYDTLVRQSYDEDIAAQIEQQEDQSVIDELIARRDAGDSSGYQYSKAEIEYYRTEVVPRLIFPQTTYIDTQSVVQQYMLGNLDTDGFIAALNEAAVN